MIRSKTIKVDKEFDRMLEHMKRKTGHQKITITRIMANDICFENYLRSLSKERPKKFKWDFKI